MSDFVQYKPSGLLRDVYVLSQLDGRYTLLVAADEVHSHKPLPQREFGVLEYRAYQYGEVVSAFVAAILAVLAFHTFDAAAVRADHTVAPALLFENLSALSFGVEVGGKCEQ